CHPRSPSVSASIPKCWPYLAAEGASASRRPPSGACVGDQPEDDPMSVMSRRTLLPAVIAAAIAYSASITGAAAHPTLYQRLGGYDSIQAVVDEAIKNIAADRRINWFFKGANIQRLRRQLADQICAASGGPCVYRGRDMKSAHAGMGIE